MPVFSIELPDKRVLDIEAGDQSTALRGAQEWHQSNPLAPVGQGEDIVKGVGGGLKTATESTLGMMGDVGSLVATGAEKLGIPEGIRSKFGQIMRTNPLTMGFTGPTSEAVSYTHLTLPTNREV